MRLQPLSSTDTLPATCPACNGRLVAKGALAVHPVDEHEQLHLWGKPWRPSELRYARCRCGSLIAVDERRKPGALEGAYTSLPDTYWNGLSQHQALARRLEAVLAELGARGDVFDVGCGDGGLLAELRVTGRKTGIEPGTAAVKAGQAKGLDLRQGSASALGLEGVADVVLAIDLLEHLAEPEAELRAIARMLRPGGYLLALTGDATARAAKLTGGWWYYLHVLGHVTVFSREALSLATHAAGLEVRELRRFEHPAAVSPRKWAQRLAGNAARLALGKRPGIAHLFRDHQLLIARRPG